MSNAQIAAAFEELADLYELDGAVQYRVLAYRTAAKAVRESSVSVMQKWLPPETLDLHGFVTPTLIEATTKPHNPSTASRSICRPRPRDVPW